MSSVPVSNDIDTLALQKKCERLRQQLARERRRMVQASVLTVIIGVAIMILLGIFFYKGYHAISTNTEPSKIVDWLQTTVDDNIPDVQRSIAQQIERNAPIWAEDMSKQLVSSAPQARRKIEDGFLQHVDNTLKETAVLSDQEFGKVLSSHRELFDQLINDAKKGVKPAERSLEQLDIALESDLQVDMKSEAKNLLNNIESVRANLNHLAAAKHLGPDQEAEKQFYMIARRLQAEEGGPGGAPRFSASKPANMSKPSAPVIKSKPNESKPKATDHKPDAAGKKTTGTKKPPTPPAPPAGPDKKDKK